ncbi:hypothetical protein CSPHI_08655 [Corynebacterium sphenisci DSM 44792]|uniref:Uncharacterized protein n=1 Tax=Corynebacterium sphenisci DSM 44792 TaxID=1437874 RepID=A0A1L7CZ29_9CORY|nr:hypothetical protein [Corynebacterium sphenisci]APT91082.1 hypothetical protein CSPHI_08655 [Corynebacterium sphenisci DSM 44792]
MGELIDGVGQWLTQLPVIGQTAVLLAVLLPVGGLAAFALIGVIDIVVGRLFGRWGGRPATVGRARVELAEHRRP